MTSSQTWTPFKGQRSHPTTNIQQGSVPPAPHLFVFLSFLCRLLSQLRDMEEAFDGFFEKHHLKMQQYQQLLLYERDFQQVRVEHAPKHTHAPAVQPVRACADGGGAGEDVRRGEGHPRRRQHAGAHPATHPRALRSGATRAGPGTAAQFAPRAPARPPARPPSHPVCVPTVRR